MPSRKEFRVETERRSFCRRLWSSFYHPYERCFLVFLLFLCLFQIWHSFQCTQEGCPRKRGKKSAGISLSSSFFFPASFFMVKRMKNRRSRPKFLRVSSSCSSSSSFLHLSSCSSSCSLYPFFFSFSRGFSSAGRASRGSLFAAAKALKLKDKAGNFLSSFPRSFLRLFFLHFDPPASSPYPAPSFSSKRQFLRYRLLQWSQHLRQKKLYGDLLTGGEPKTRTRSRRRGQEEEEDQTKALPLSFLFSLLPSFSSSSSSLSRLRSSSSFSFFDPRWRPPALWPSFRPLPSSRPPPEVVAHEHRREKDGLCQRERKKRQEEEAEEEGGKPTLTEVCPDAARREGKSFLSSSSSFSSLSSSSAMPLRVQCIGHGTFLLQCGGLNVLTDPIFAYKAGPYGVLGGEWCGGKRKEREQRTQGANKRRKHTQASWSLLLLALLSILSLPSSLAFSSPKCSWTKRYAGGWPQTGS